MTSGVVKLFPNLFLLPGRKKPLYTLSILSQPNLLFPLQVGKLYHFSGTISLFSDRAVSDAADSALITSTYYTGDVCKENVVVLRYEEGREYEEGICIVKLLTSKGIVGVMRIGTAYASDSFKEITEKSSRNDIP